MGQPHSRGTATKLFDEGLVIVLISLGISFKRKKRSSPSQDHANNPLFLPNLISEVNPVLKPPRFRNLFAKGKTGAQQLGEERSGSVNCRSNKLIFERTTLARAPNAATFFVRHD